jgi:hypothetical protein
MDPRTAQIGPSAESSVDDLAWQRFRSRVGDQHAILIWVDAVDESDPVQGVGVGTGIVRAQALFDPLQFCSTPTSSMPRVPESHVLGNISGSLPASREAPPPTRAARHGIRTHRGRSSPHNPGRTVVTGRRLRCLDVPCDGCCEHRASLRRGYRYRRYPRLAAPVSRHC